MKLSDHNAFSTGMGLRRALSAVCAAAMCGGLLAGSAAMADPAMKFDNTPVKTKRQDQVIAYLQDRVNREQALVHELKREIADQPALVITDVGGNRGVTRVWTEPSDEAGDTVTRLFNHLDTDSNGALTFYEAGDSWIVLENYEALDMDKDGKISRDEFVAGLPEDLRTRQ